MLQKNRAAALLGIVAALVAEGGGTGGTPDASKPQPVHSAPRSLSEVSTAPSDDSSSRPAPAASPSHDTAANRSTFKGPEGVAVDARGDVYVANTSDHTIVKVTSEGVLTTLAGSSGEKGSADGTGSAARFSFPRALAVDSVGNVYVVDNDAVRKVSSVGAVTTLAGLPGSVGNADGKGRAMRLSSPEAIAVDQVGDVYVGDSGNCTLRKVTASGVGTTVAGRAGRCDIVDGAGSGARFTAIQGVALDSAGNVYVAEIDKFKGVAIRRVTPKGVVTTLSRSRGLEGAGVVPSGFVADFGAANGIAIDAGGNLYISDYVDVVWKVTPTGIATHLAGSPQQPGHEDGRGGAARFRYPKGLAVDSAGRVYVADSGNGSIRIISSEGEVTTLPVRTSAPAP